MLYIFLTFSSFPFPQNYRVLHWKEALAPRCAQLSREVTVLISALRWGPSLLLMAARWPVSIMAAVLVLCRGGPETDYNSKNLSTPKAPFKLVLEEAASLTQVKTSDAFCMDGSGICLVRQSWSIPCALLQSHRFTGLQADDPLVVLRKTPTFPTARVDGILWAMWIQAGKWSSVRINRGHDGSWWTGMHQPARDLSASSQCCKRLPKRFKLLLGMWD